MTCQELIDFLDDYVAGTLPPNARERFDRHLAVCVDCRNYLESYKRTIRLGKQVFAEDEDDGDGQAPPVQRELPPDVPDGLIEAILAATGVAKPRRAEEK